MTDEQREMLLAAQSELGRAIEEQSDIIHKAQSLVREGQRRLIDLNGKLAMCIAVIAQGEESER